MSEKRTFRLEVERETGALERVLGVVRRRRLDLHHFEVATADDGTWRIAIHAGAPEPALTLRQLSALTNVRRASLDDAATS